MRVLLLFLNTNYHEFTRMSEHIQLDLFDDLPQQGKSKKKRQKKIKPEDEPLEKKIERVMKVNPHHHPHR